MVKAEAEAEAEVEVEVEAEAEADVDVDFVVDLDFDCVNLEADVNLDAEADAEADAGTEAEAEAEVEADAPPRQEKYKLVFALILRNPLALKNRADDCDGLTLRPLPDRAKPNDRDRARLSDRCRRKRAFMVATATKQRY